MEENAASQAVQDVGPVPNDVGEPESTPVDDIDPQSEDEEISFVYSITAYGADYPVDSLVSRLRNGDIEVPPFQRGFVWSKPKCDRFIESLLLGLPVPGIFLAREQETGKLLVIDGQQRLRTLQAFYTGILRARQFSLGNGVQETFRGKTFEALEDEDRRRLNDSIIHATIIRQDEPSEDQSSIYFIFERLNTGGLLLQPQEIRTAIYQGQLDQLLAELNGRQTWRNVFGAPSPRMKDRELILRFLAFFYEPDRYTRPMKEFLNSFMSRHRNLQDLESDAITRSFCEPLKILVTRIPPSELFRPVSAINAAVFDSVMVGLARRIADGSGMPEAQSVEQHYRALLADDEFVRLFTQSTAVEANVARRLELATTAFADLE